MAIQEFDLGNKGSGAVYPLMEQFMASMSKNAEEIGNNIRTTMLRTEANNQTQEMSAALRGAELFNQDGTSKPDAMSKLMSIMAGHPLGASSPVGQMMFEGLGKQIEYNMPITGSGGGQPVSTGTGAGAGNATTFGLNPDGSVDKQDNGVGFKGADTRDPNLVGVALHPDDLKGAGIPYRDWQHTVVEVTNPQTGQTQRGKVVDLLGNKNASIDLTYGMTKALGTDGKTPVNWKIVGVDNGASPDKSAGSPLDMFREPIAAIDKRMSVLQSLLPRVITKGNHVTFNATQNQIDKLQAQKDKLIEMSAVQSRADKREQLSQDKSDRDERRLDMMQQRIDDAEKKGDETTASKLRTEHRMAIKDQLAPVEKELAMHDKNLAVAKTKVENLMKKVDDGTASGDALKRVRTLQKEVQSIQALKDATQKKVDGLSQRLADLDKDVPAPPLNTEKVVVQKDGKQFRLPKSQLDDALSQGYTVVQ